MRSNVGHTLRKSSKSLTQQAVLWDPHGPGGRETPSQTWVRNVEHAGETISTQLE